MDDETDFVLLNLDNGNHRSGRKNRNKPQLPVKPEPAFRGLGTRGKSYKKYRRFENANMLAKILPVDLADEDEVYAELNIYDFIPQTMSPFARLLIDQEKMKVISHSHTFNLAAIM